MAQQFKKSWLAIDFTVPNLHESINSLSTNGKFYPHQFQSAQ
jgi:hypothetical protein